MTIDKIKKIMPWIITGIVLATLLVLQFTVISANTDILTTEFFSNLAVNLTIIVSISLAWMYGGKDKAKTNDTSYCLNNELYGNKVDEINRNGKLNRLSEFCGIKTDSLIEAEIKRLLSGVAIDYETYKEDYVGLNGKQLKAKGLTRKQRKIINKVQKGKIGIRKIDPNELTTDSKGSNEWDIHYNERADQGGRIGIKMVQSLISAFVLSILVIQLSANINDITAWAMFCTKLSMAVSSAFSGYNEGYNMIADTKNKVIRRRIMFLNLFLEWDTRAIEAPKIENKSEVK